MDVKEDNYISNSVFSSHIDNDVYQDIVKTFSKETICLFPLGNLAKANVQANVIKKVENTEYEISPFHKHDIDCNQTKTTSFFRKPSLSQFSNKRMDFEVLKQFLVNSYAVDETGRRPYPSGGALYPVEPLVFIFEDRVDKFNEYPSGCYHFRPVSKTLQLIKKFNSSWLYDDLLLAYLDKNHLPTFGVVYMAHIGKTIFKYRYRGYRHALIEVGAMCQVASTVAQEIGVRSTIWSTFSEYQLLQELDLDYALFMPIMMQFFGYPEV